MKLVVHGFGLFTRVCVQSDAKRVDIGSFLRILSLFVKRRRKCVWCLSGITLWALMMLC